MLSSKQIARFFDHQYLWKESTDIFDCLYGDRKVAIETITLVWYGQVCPATCYGAFDWSGVVMARLKIVHNERLIYF